MEKKRTRAQDAAKGLMIIAVVFFHCWLTVSANPQESLMTFNLLSAFFPFLISSFFFYTGYNYVPNGKSFKENIIKRAKQLLIPLVFCWVISIILISAMELAVNHSDIGATFQSIGNTILYSLMSQPMAMMLNFPQSGGVIFELVVALGLVWFLYALFICSIFFYLLVNHTNKNLFTLVSVDIVLLAMGFCLGEFVGTYLPYTVQCFPVILAIMLTASYLRQSHFLNRRILSKKDSLFHAINMIVAEGIVVGVCLICHYRAGAIFTGSLPGGQFDAQLKGFDAFISFLFSIVGTYFLHTLCRLLKHIPGVGRALQWVGNHSATFYLFHPIFMGLVSIVFFRRQVIWGQWQAFFYVFTTVLLLTVTCLLLDLLVVKKDIKRVKQAVEEVDSNKAPEDLQYEREDLQTR